MTVEKRFHCMDNECSFSFNFVDKQNHFRFIMLSLHGQKVNFFSIPNFREFSIGKKCY